MVTTLAHSLWLAAPDKQHDQSLLIANNRCQFSQCLCDDESYKELLGPACKTWRFLQQRNLRKSTWCTPNYLDNVLYSCFMAYAQTTAHAQIIIDRKLPLKTCVLSEREMRRPRCRSTALIATVFVGLIAVCSSVVIIGKNDCGIRTRGAGPDIGREGGSPGSVWVASPPFQTCSETIWRLICHCFLAIPDSLTYFRQPPTPPCNIVVSEFVLHLLHRCYRMWRLWSGWLSLSKMWERLWTVFGV